MRRYDRFRARIQAIADMPDNTVDLLFRLQRQNSGKIAQRAREKEFAGLTDARR
ncbi:MAG TPA: hypothetical protein VFY29_17985 [Terriglobia bacterium]|nr:hypothetical protein [Terriglobia bacterium]